MKPKSGPATNRTGSYFILIWNTWKGTICILTSCRRSIGEHNSLLVWSACRWQRWRWGPFVSSHSEIKYVTVDRQIRGQRISVWDFICEKKKKIIQVCGIKSCLNVAGLYLMLIFITWNSSTPWHLQGFQPAIQLLFGLSMYWHQWQPQNQIWAVLAIRHSDQEERWRRVAGLGGSRSRGFLELGDRGSVSCHKNQAINIALQM